jgi:hypothetical protein
MPLVVLPISGQAGNIQVTLADSGTAITLQVRNWRIEMTFDTPDVTTTGSRGWGENKTVLNRWRGACDLPFDLNRSTYYQGVTEPYSGFYVTSGLCYWVSAQAYFQIGAAGTPLEPDTNPLQYQGKLRLTVYETINPATNIVETRISFLGTGPLIGPVQGQLSNALIADSL